MNGIISLLFLPLYLFPRKDIVSACPPDQHPTVCKDVDWERLAIVVVKIEADFVSQIKGNNHIAGRTRITKIGNKSFHLEQDIIDTDTQEVKSHCTSIMVLYDLEHHQTIPLPDEWRQAISNYEGPRI